MSRVMRTAGCFALLSMVAWAGCANPADDKFKVTATEPKAETAPAPALAPSPAPAGPGASAPATTPAATPAVPAGALALDASASKIDFVGSKVTGSHSGGFKTFSGSAELSSDQSSLAKVSVEIDMGSTWSDDERLTGHLKSPDFFDVAKNPKATFVSTEIKPGGEKGATHTITGNLTLHGVTKSLSFPATVAVKDGALSLNSEFALNRKDFAINYPGRANDLIRDEVVIKLDVKAKKA
ncbi:MAG: YceI family protein [Isosphaeraceae bacterium]